MKRLLSILLCIALVVTMIPATALANDGGEGTRARLVFGTEAGIADAVQAETMSLESAADKLYNSDEITAGENFERYIYIAVYGRDEQGGADMNDLRDVLNVPSEDAEYIADYPAVNDEGEDYDVVGDAIRDLTFSVTEGKLTAYYNGNGGDVFAENNAGYRINLYTSDGGRYGTLQMRIKTQQNSGQGGNEGGQPLPGKLYFIYDNDNLALDGNRIKINGELVSGRENVSNAIDQYGVEFIEGSLGGRRGYFAIKDNSDLIAVFGVESSNEHIADIRYNDNGTQEIRMKNPGTAWLTLVSDDGQMAWEMRVTGTVSGLNIRGGGWTAPPGNIGNGIFMSIMTVYDGEEVATNYAVRSTNPEVGIVEITPDGKIEFMPKSAGETDMVITYNEQEYVYQICVEEQDLNYGGGNGGNQGGNGDQPIHIMNVDGQYFYLNTIFTNELGDENKFYFALETDGNSMPQNLKYELEDKYMSMANGGYHREEGIMDTISDAAGIKVTPIAKIGNEALYANLGLDKMTRAYQLYEASVNNEKLTAGTYMKAGIVNGWIRFYDDNGNIIAETEMSVFTDQFYSDVPVENGSMIHFLDMECDPPRFISEKTLKMYEPVNGEENTIYVQAPEEPVIEAFLTYEERKQNGTVTGYQFIDEIPVSQYEGDIYKFNLPAFYGHNNIILAASCNESNDLQLLTVKKAVQYKYTAGGLDVAEIAADYLNQLAVENQLPNVQPVQVLGAPVTADGYTTREYSEIGNVRTSNRPYNGGFFGMTLDIADGYELDGVKVTGFDSNGNAAESGLWYLMMQNCYFTAFNPNGTIDENMYQSSIGMQTPFVIGQYGMIEAATNLAEYFYSEDAGEYEVYTYADNAQAVANSMGNMKNYADEEGINVSFIETSTYYDIGLMKDYATIEEFYADLDKIGTVEFVLNQASAEDAFFDEDADEKDAAGIKPGDSASGKAWGENHKFEDFAWIKKDNGCYEGHNQDIQNFYGEDAKKVVGAYEFEMQQNETFPGMVDIYIPVPAGVDYEFCTIYWMYDGVPVPLPCRYVDGYMVFSTSHFSEYVIAADEDAISDEYTEDTTGSSGGGVAGDSGEGGNEGGTAGGGTAGGGSAGGGSWYPAVPADPNVDAKTEAENAVTNYVDEAEYDKAEAEEIAAIVAQAKKDIQAAGSADEIKAIEEAAKAEIDKLETAEEKVLISEVEAVKFKTRSKMTKLNGKKAIKVYWNSPEDMEFDGFDVYRSIKKNKGFGKKPFYTSKANYYINNKALKTGNTYYYKVRGFKYVNDEKVYTQWSYKAWRTIKK